MVSPAPANRSPEHPEPGHAPEEGTGTHQPQIRASDARRAAFREDASRQSLAVANSPWAEEDQAFIDAISTRGKDDDHDRRGA